MDPVPLEVLDRVTIISLGISGLIRNVRLDSGGERILKIWLDNPDATPDGVYFARDYEVVRAL